METNSSIRPMAAVAALALLAAVALSQAGCGGGRENPVRDAANSGAAQKGAAKGGAAGLDEQIVRLERQAERNPADDETRVELARAYVRRGDTQRAAGQLREALSDYRRALRLDPDNSEAQNNAFSATQQLGGEQQGENGEPPPPPISPNVADEDERPTPTPKKQ